MPDDQHATALRQDAETLFEWVREDQADVDHIKLQASCSFWTALALAGVALATDSQLTLDFLSQAAGSETPNSVIQAGNGTIKWGSIVLSVYFAACYLDARMNLGIAEKTLRNRTAGFEGRRLKLKNYTGKDPYAYLDDKPDPEPKPKLDYDPEKAWLSLFQLHGPKT